MTKKHSHFETPLAKARGHGASHSAVAHWWFQRVTAVALLFLLPWFVVSLLRSMLSPDVGMVANWFASPLHSVGMVLLLIATFWHAKLGFQVVVEDYVHAPFAKYALLLLNNFIAIAAITLGAVAVLRMHMIDLSSFGA
ncbi:MAG: succinate dehydrogenase, hydrophobic membrane anchor protein [Alphaproteobacteria bacterium]|nr:succinate dehydrogenase, hydrophobic membrane anchor protein [Alphaproteobacteria bacterium]